MSRAFWTRLQLITMICLFIVALGARVLSLGRLPGINADEAWYAVQVARFLRGDAHTIITPNGPVAFPGHLALVWLLELLGFEHNFVTLRLPALLMGILVPPAGFLLLRSHFGRGIALTCSLLLASAPMLVAYSRFSWWAAYMPLASLLILWSCLRRNVAWFVVTIILGLTIHPTAIFLIPICVGLVWGSLMEENSPLLKQLSVTRGFIFLGAMLLLAGVAIITLETMGIPWYSGSLPERIARPWGFGFFALGVARLGSGHTIYRYIVGSLSENTSFALDLIAVVMLSIFGILGTRAAWRARYYRRIGLYAGLAASAGLVWILAGDVPVTPASARYGTFLLVPLTLSLTLAMHDVLHQRFLAVRFAPIFVSGLLLIGFESSYLSPLETTGGHGEFAFRTAAVEPKVAAFAAIRESFPGATIATDDFFLYYPLSYLALDAPDVSVVWLTQEFLDGVSSAPDDAAQTRFVVSFPRARFARFADETQLAAQKFIIPDAGGKPAVVLYELPRPPSFSSDGG